MLSPGNSVFFTTGDPSRVIPVRLTNGDTARVMQLTPVPQGDPTRIQPVQLTTDERAIPVQMKSPLMANMAAWYRYGIGITDAGGGAVSAWADQSGNGRNALQGTGANRPTLNADNSITADSTTVAKSLEVAFTLNQPCTIYALMRTDSWGSGKRFLGGSAVDAGLFYGGVTPQIILGMGVNLSSVSLAIGSYGVVAGVGNGASSVIQLNNGTPVTGNAGTDNPGGVSIGNNSVPNVTGMSVTFKEVILFSAAHDATQRSIIINYLMAVNSGII